MLNGWCWCGGTAAEMIGEGAERGGTSEDEELTARDGVVAKLTASDVKDAGGGSTPSSTSMPICVRGTKDHTKDTVWH